MKTKLLIASILLSSNVLASSQTTSHMFPVPRLRVNQEGTVESSHSYTITNETNSPQLISFCHQVATCTEWPLYIKANRKCEDFSLAAHETKSGEIHMQMKISYPITGWCTATASTEIKGGTYHISSHDIKFQIGQ